MATYFATFGFPHGEKKKPVLIHGPNKSREEQRAEFQKAAMSKTNPKYSEIHLVSSSRGAVKKKRFGKGPWKNREDALQVVAETPQVPEVGDLKAGEIVHLKSGSPALTILSIDESKHAELQYDDGEGGHETTKYHVDALTRTPTPVGSASPFVTTEIPKESGSAPEILPPDSAASQEGLGSNDNDSEDIPDQSGAGDEESE